MSVRGFTVWFVFFQESKKKCRFAGYSRFLRLSADFTGFWRSTCCHKRIRYLFDVKVHARAIGKLACWQLLSSSFINFNNFVILTKSICDIRLDALW